MSTTRNSSRLSSDSFLSAKSEEVLKNLDAKSKAAFKSILSEIDKKMVEFKQSVYKQLSEISDDVIHDLKQSICTYADEVTSLKKEVTMLRAENNNLKLKLDAMEQRQCSNRIILSGGIVSDLNWNTPDNVPEFKKASWVAKKVLQDCNLEFDREYKFFSAAFIGKHSNGKKSSSIVLELDDVISKRSIFSAVIEKKSKRLYVNEYLTTHRRELLKDVLELRKTIRNVSCKVFTKNGIVTIKSEIFNYPKSIFCQKDLEEATKKLLDASLRN